MTNPFRLFDKRDWALWIVSLLIVGGANIAAPDTNWLTFVTTLLGVTTLIFDAKGHVAGPLVGIVFCTMYAGIAYQYHYWGEMMTFLGLSTPMCIWALVTWLRHPSRVEGEVQVNKLSRAASIGVLLASLPVTAVFGVLLWKLHTPNLAVSTISVTASFLGATYTVLRSPLYALGYAFNDIVLIILWVLASITDPVYIPVVVEFVIFLVNDLYGYYCWRVREKDIT